MNWRFMIVFIKGGADDTFVLFFRGLAFSQGVIFSRDRAG